MICHTKLARIPTPNKTSRLSTLILTMLASCVAPYQRTFSRCFVHEFKSSSFLRLNSSSTSIANGEKSKTSIAIVGSGAVGLYYGARLWECREKYDVRFHFRSEENYQVCNQKGLHIKVTEHLLSFICDIIDFDISTYTFNLRVHFRVSQLKEIS